MTTSTTILPKIIYRNQPAVLILLEGEPRLLPIPLSTLMRVANTPFMMVYAPADKAYYLRAGESWVTSFTVQGPWQLVENLPSSISELEEKVKLERAKQAKAAESEKKVELKAGELPEIIVSTVPSELIVTEGSLSTLPSRIPTCSMSATLKTTSSWTRLPGSFSCCSPVAGSAAHLWKTARGRMYHRPNFRLISRRSPKGP